MENSKTTKTSLLFSLMNNIRRTHNVSQKEAYKMAKEQLEELNKKVAEPEIKDAAPVNSANPVVSDDPKIAEKLEAAMKAGNVRFSFINERGKVITTTGTLRPEAVPTTRKVDGKQTAKSDNMCVFYDVRHGIYRQFNVNKIVGITNEAVKRGRVKKETPAVENGDTVVAAAAE